MVFSARLFVLMVIAVLPACANQPIPLVQTAPAPAPAAAPVPPQAATPEPAPQPQVDFATWLKDFRAEALAAGIAAETFDRALKDVEPDPQVIDLDQRQHTGKLDFARYIARLAGPKRRKAVREHLDDHRLVLDEIGKRYGVPPRFIVALWGIESDFGAAPGDYSVISSLATLAYDGRRAPLFRHELIAALRIIQDNKVDPADMKGSWAGAMGQNQFMPSTYLDYAVSYKGTGKPDIWTDEEDVFASIANYLAKLGWHADEAWGRMVKVPPGLSADLIGLTVTKPVKEWKTLGVTRADGSPLPPSDLSASLLLPDGDTGPAMLVFENYRTILKWNNSTGFAASVGLLADSAESH